MYCSLLISYENLFDSQMYRYRKMCSITTAQFEGVEKALQLD